MDTAQFHRRSETNPGPAGERLDSWKEIATYLRRSVRTLHRWEKEEGLPVHRQLHKELGSVYAFKSELDAWCRARSIRSERKESDASRAVHRKLVIAALALTFAGVLAATIYSVTRGRSDHPGPQRKAPVARLELLSTLAEPQRVPSLSPDGHQMAFVSEAAGTPQVFVRNLAGADPVQVTFGEFPAMRPQWSARGDRIIYSIRGSGIWTVSPLGRDPRQIVQHGWNPELSPDGKRLVFERSGQLVVTSADGRDSRALSNIPVETYYGDAWPTFSPDGESIAVFLGEEGRYGDYWIIPLDGRQARRLTNDLAEGGAPAWTPDGKSLVFPSTRAGSMNVWRVAIGGGPPEPLTTGPGDDVDPKVAPDGRSVSFTNVRRTWTVSVLDQESRSQRIIVERRTAIAYPAFSRDGRRVAFQAKTPQGDMHLVVVDSDGSNEKAVTHGVGELNIMPQWSGDDRSLYFYQARPRRVFRRLSLSAGTSEDVAPWSWSRQPFADVDAHGRTAVHSVIDRGQLHQSRLRNLDNGAETTLPFALYLHRYSRDGRWVAGESRDGEAVVCDMADGRCVTLTPKDEHGLAAVAWSGDGTRLFLLRHTPAQVFGELASVSLQGGAVKTHGRIGPFQHRYLMSMDVSPRDEVVAALCREGPHELWLARLR